MWRNHNCREAEPHGRGNFFRKWGGTPLIVTDNDGTLDKTWQEIYDAYPNVMLQTSNRKVVFSEINSADGLYTVLAVYDVYETLEANGYPILNADD